MSRDQEDKTYEYLVFEGFLKVLSHKGRRLPLSIPEGYENLRDDEKIALAYLYELSSARSHAAQESSSVTTPVNVPENEPELEPEGPLGLVEYMSLAPVGKNDGEAIEAGTVSEDLNEHTAFVQPELGAAVQGDNEEAGILDEHAPSKHVGETLNDQSEDSAQTLVESSPDGTVINAATTSKEGDDMIRGPGGIPKVGPGNPSAEPERINLKNGRSRQMYKTLIEGYSQIRVRDDGGSGLTISEDGDVTGEGIAAGEYTIMLDAVKSGRPTIIRARLSIIADPRDLWHDIPSDQQADMAKPDEDFDTQTGEAFIVAASKRGRSHAQEGKYRDDDFSISADTETGWHILVVADGAGSAELSREGSRIACDTVMQILPSLLVEIVDPGLGDVVTEYEKDPDAWALRVRRELLRPVLPDAALKAAQAIEAKANEIGRKPHEFSTTIVIAVSKKISNVWVSASFTVGDGGVAVFDAGTAKVDVLCRPDSGEFAGQTRFLASSEFLDDEDVLGRVFVDVKESFTVLAAMTDGITDPKFPTDNVFANPQSWTEFWCKDLCPHVELQPDNAALKEQLLTWLDFWSRGNHDDRTIALMLPSPPGGASISEDASMTTKVNAPQQP